MIKKIRNYFRKRKAIKHGTMIFTFPDGERLYQLKEDYFEKLPNAKLEYIQENANYIAHLGISKYTLFSAVKKVRELQEEVKALIRLKQDPTKQIGQIDKILGYIDGNTRDYEKTQSQVVISLFDMFFFFEDEDIFTWSEEALEKKKWYLDNFPYFKNFFFRKLEDYQTAYKITFESAIRYAIQQAGIQEAIKDWDFTSIKEAGTDWWCN